MGGGVNAYDRAEFLYPNHPHLVVMYVITSMDVTKPFDFLHYQQHCIHATPIALLLHTPPSPTQD